MNDTVFTVLEYAEMFKFNSDYSTNTIAETACFAGTISEHVFDDKEKAIKYMNECKCKKILETIESVIYSYFVVSELGRNSDIEKYKHVAFITEKHITF